MRALVHGYLTAQRLGGSVVLSNADRNVRRLMSVLRLDTVILMFESVDAAIAAAPAGVSPMPGDTPAGRSDISATPVRNPCCARSQARGIRVRDVTLTLTVVPHLRNAA